MFARGPVGVSEDVSRSAIVNLGWASESESNGTQAFLRQHRLRLIIAPTIRMGCRHAYSLFTPPLFKLHPKTTHL